MFCCIRSFSCRAKFFRIPILRRMLCSQKDNDTNMNNDKLWTIPNGLCFARIAASPIIFDLVVTNHHVAALFLVAAAGTTDLVDGYIARRWPSQQSNIGSVLDPLADKILVTTVFLSLSYAALIPVPLTSLVVGKDLYLIGASINVRYKNMDQPKTISRFFNPKVFPSATISQNLLGKTSTFVQLSLVCFTLIGSAFGFDVTHNWAMDKLWYLLFLYYYHFIYYIFFMYLTAITTVMAGASYAISNKAIKLSSKRKL